MGALSGLNGVEQLGTIDKAEETKRFRETNKVKATAVVLNNCTSILDQHDLMEALGLLVGQEDE